MSDNAQKKLPNWHACYDQTDLNNLPWYFTQLDPDVFDILARLNVVGGSLLDLGTGSGNQAIELARRGFDVCGTDISEGALAQAINLAKKESVNCSFLIDDILNTKLPKNRFDYVFDRGCFHILAPDDRKRYIDNILQVTKRRAMLFLKCFSSEEPWTEGPYRFSEQELSELFLPHFELTHCLPTVFHGRRDPLPKALFCVFRKVNF